MKGEKDDYRHGNFHHHRRRHNRGPLLGPKETLREDYFSRNTSIPEGTMEVIRRNGLIATPRTAKKEHRCRQCPRPIEVGTMYYEVVVGGGGLGSLKFPDRVHAECVEIHLDKGGKREDG